MLLIWSVTPTGFSLLNEGWSGSVTDQAALIIILLGEGGSIRESAVLTD